MTQENAKSVLEYLDSKPTAFERFAEQVRKDIAKGSLDHLLEFPKGGKFDPRLGIVIDKRGSVLTLIDHD